MSVEPINRLEEIARKHFTSLSALAKELGLSSGYFYNYTSGKKGLGGILLKKLRKVGINPDYIMTGEGEEFLDDYPNPKHPLKVEEPINEYADGYIIEETIKVPLLEQSVEAGHTAPLEAYIKEYIGVAKSFDIADKEPFAIRIHGDSMYPDLKEGDLAIFIDVQPKHGDIVLAYIDGEATVKQLKVYEDGIEFRPLNKKYRAIIPSEGSDYYIKGVMCGVQKMTNRFRGF